MAADSVPGFVALNDAPEAAPVVWFVPDGDGSTRPLASLAAALAPEWAVYGLDSPLAGAEDAPYSAMETLALRLASVIRRADGGPYRLVGVGVGSVVAFEVARQLVASGAVVAHVVFVDGGPGLGGVPHPLRRRVGALEARVTGRAARLASARRPVPARWRTHHSRARHAQLAAGYDWAGRHIPGPATVVWASDLASADGSLGWSGPVRGELAVVHLAASHADLFDGHPPAVAEAVRSALGQAG